MLDVCIVEELNKEHPDTAQVTAWTQEREELEAQLAAMPTAETAQFVVGADVPSSPQEETVENINTDSLGLEETQEVAPLEPSTEPTKLVTVEDLGLDAARGGAPVFNSLSIDHLTDCLKAIPNKDGEESTWAMLFGPKSVLDEEHMIVIDSNQDRSDLKKLARGLALSLVGAVQDDGSVIGTRGGVYYPTFDPSNEKWHGKCYTIVEETVSLLGGNVVTKREIPCAGLPRYKGDGDSARATKREDARCLHMASHEFELGGWVAFQTVNRNGKDNQALKSVLVAMAEVAGDADARRRAEEQVAIWRANNKHKRAGWAELDRTVQDARNQGNVTAEGRMPPVPEAADALVGNTGRTVREIVTQDGGGRQFIVRYTMNLENGSFPGQVRAINLNAFADAIVPPWSTQQRNVPGSQLQIDEVLFL